MLIKLLITTVISFVVSMPALANPMSPPTQKAPSAPITLQLDGIKRHGNNITAFINGQGLSVGQQLQEFRVIDITSNSVLLKSKSRSIRLNLFNLDISKPAEKRSAFLKKDTL